MHLRPSYIQRICNLLRTGGVLRSQTGVAACWDTFFSGMRPVAACWVVFVTGRSTDAPPCSLATEIFKPSVGEPRIIAAPAPREGLTQSADKVEGPQRSPRDRSPRPGTDSVGRTSGADKSPRAPGTPGTPHTPGTPGTPHAPGTPGSGRSSGAAKNDSIGRAGGVARAAAGDKSPRAHTDGVLVRPNKPLPAVPQAGAAPHEPVDPSLRLSDKQRDKRSNIAQEMYTTEVTFYESVQDMLRGYGEVRISRLFCVLCCAH